MLRHRGVQLILAYSWARPAILVLQVRVEGGDVFISSVSLLSFLVRLCVYVTSPERPTDIGLQLGKACYPCSR